MRDRPLLLFDMDGTLIITEDKPVYNGLSTSHAPYVSLRDEMKRAAAEHGIPWGEFEGLDRMAHIWNRVREFAEKNGFDEGSIETLMEAINGPFTAEESEDHSRSHLLPNTLDALEQLSKHYELGLVTTASRRAYKRISRSPEYGCFGRFFRHSVTRDDCYFIKPAPEPIQRILDLFRRSDFIYIGDSDHDAQAARAAGGGFVLINSRRYGKKTLEELDPDAVIDSLTELPSVLEGMF